MSEEEGSSSKRCRSHSDDDDDDDEELDLEVMQQRPSADDFELDSAEEAPHTFKVPALPVGRRARSLSDNHLVPFEMIPQSNVNAVRPEHAVVDSVSYYNHVGLWTLMYAHVTQGVSTPAIFDAKAQRM